MCTVVFCMLVIVAQSIVVGAGSMAFLLRQHVEHRISRKQYLRTPSYIG